MPKCQMCGTRLDGILEITDNSLGWQCPICFEFHNWATGKLLRKEVKKK